MSLGPDRTQTHQRGGGAGSGPGDMDPDPGGEVGWLRGVQCFEVRNALEERRRVARDGCPADGCAFDTLISVLGLKAHQTR